jgi:hypothetical protein
MKSLSPAIQKIWPMLKVLKSGSNFKVTRSKILVTIERSCHKEHTYEIPITYHSKDMANVKVFARLYYIRKLLCKFELFWLIRYSKEDS